MNDYSSFPPYEFFNKVLSHYPRAALLYTQLWGLKDKNSKVFKIGRGALKEFFFISPTLFKNYLTSLSKLGVLSMRTSPDSFVIHFKENC